jgi:dTDP-4-amino-4,6-dideoxygalactose transaminase
MIGNFGNAEVFSFHATKFFNTFEGGAVVTNDDELAAKVRLMRNFGFSGYDNVIYVGVNGKMTEIAAAMGLTGLESLDEFIAINRRNYDVYARLLGPVAGIQVRQYDDRERNNFQYVIVEVEEKRTGVSRDEIVRALHAENVLARRYFYPGCHRMEPYRSYFPHAGLLLPRTEWLSGRVLSLPTGTAIDESAAMTVAELLRLIAENGEEVRRRLRTIDGSS